MEKEKGSSEADAAAMVELAKGHDEALNQIMERWQRPITTFLYRSIGDHHAAVDLAQEVFVRLYRNCRNFRSGGSFSSYIFTIAANLAKNHYRWKQRHPESGLDEDSATLAEGPDTFLEKNEDDQAVRRAILSLPENLRLPIVMYYFEDLSQAEIGRILDCSEKSVETRLYRGRKILKEKLA